MLKDEESKKYDSFKSDAVNEQTIKDLRSQLNTRETELKRLRAEMASTQKRLEKVGMRAALGLRPTIAHSLMHQNKSRPQC